MRNDWGVHYAENESVISTGSGVNRRSQRRMYRPVRYRFIVVLSAPQFSSIQVIKCHVALKSSSQCEEKV
jgi:hypothetical protein